MLLVDGVDSKAAVVATPIREAGGDKILFTEKLKLKKKRLKMFKGVPSPQL